MMIRSQKRDILVDTAGTTFRICPKEKLIPRMSADDAKEITDDFVVLSCQKGIFAILGTYSTMQESLAALDQIQECRQDGTCIMP